MPQVGKLIPLSEYKKPLLQLTKVDKVKIAEINKTIRGYQFKLQPLEDQLRIPWLSERDKAFLRFQREDLLNEIRLMQDEIRNIKVERYKEQLNLLA